jgi:iron-sulfur cluster repair protein YtfE (RIC family)
MIKDRIQDWAERSMGALVLERPGRSVAFEHFGLDYCCGGKERLATACERKGLELGTVIAALERADASPETEDLTWQASPLMAINHIVSTHHAYTKEALPRLRRLTQSIVGPPVPGPCRQKTTATQWWRSSLLVAGAGFEPATFGL